MSTSTADPDSVNGRLADFLCERKEEILRSWVARVQAAGSGTAVTLTTNQLRDHLPRLFDDLADILRRYSADDVAKQTEKDAARHGAERWQQGFDPAEVLREVSQLREIFIYHLRVFEEMNPDFGMAARLFANSTVHRFLDELAIEAMEQFLSLDKQARREAAGII